jgi:hypothetical protein
MASEEQTSETRFFAVVRDDPDALSDGPPKKAFFAQNIISPLQGAHGVRFVMKSVG